MADANHNTALDRLAARFIEQMKEMREEIDALKLENKRLKRQLSDAYDWSQEVAG